VSHKREPLNRSYLTGKELRVSRVRWGGCFQCRWLPRVLRSVQLHGLLQRHRDHLARRRVISSAAAVMSPWHHRARRHRRPRERRSTDDGRRRHVHRQHVHGEVGEKTLTSQSIRLQRASATLRSQDTNNQTRDTQLKTQRYWILETSQTHEQRLTSRTQNIADDLEKDHKHSCIHITCTYKQNELFVCHITNYCWILKINLSVNLHCIQLQSSSATRNKSLNNKKTPKMFSKMGKMATRQKHTHLWEVLSISCNKQSSTLGDWMILTPLLHQRSRPILYN